MFAGRNARGSYAYVPLPRFHAMTCGARTVWLDAAAPSWAENAYSTMSAADREKRRLAAEAGDVAVAGDRTIGELAALPDAVDGALS